MTSEEHNQWCKDLSKLSKIETENTQLKNAILSAPGSDEPYFLADYRVWWDNNFRPLREKQNLPVVMVSITRELSSKILCVCGAFISSSGHPDLRDINKMQLKYACEIEHALKEIEGR